MHTLYLVSVWLHILAATLWIGGIFFLVLVVVPWLRSGATHAGLILRETAGRFRTVAWASFAVLLLTGILNLWLRGVRPGHFMSPEWLASPYGSVIVAKLAVFALVIGLSVRHDFFVGPRAAAAIERDPGCEEAVRLRREASIHGRVTAVLALVLVALAVMIVRGRPW